MSFAHTAFYRFVPLTDPPQIADRVRAWGESLALTGSVMIASEGINGGVAGSEEAVQSFERALRGVDEFADMSFKRSEGCTAPYAKLKVNVAKQIVSFGPPEPFARDNNATTAVSPHEWRDLIARDDVVVIDNRNSFEYRLGRFEGALDPNVSHFSDFESFVQKNAATWRAQNKTVAMYCTGGIRCERVAPWMQSLGLKVAELEGGVLNYFATMNDAKREWRGECFVFDNRIALDTQLQETATTEANVYDAALDGEWRITRAKRLRAAVERGE